MTNMERKIVGGHELEQRSGVKMTVTYGKPTETVWCRPWHDPHLLVMDYSKGI